jgi:hypothetical protein
MKDDGESLKENMFPQSPYNLKISERLSLTWRSLFPFLLSCSRFWVKVKYWRCGCGWDER